MDRYTKVILTVIAGALTALAIEQGMRPAVAQSECGTAVAPCFVTYADGAKPCLDYVCRVTMKVDPPKP